MRPIFRAAAILLTMAACSWDRPSDESPLPAYVAHAAADPSSRYLTSVIRPLVAPAVAGMIAAPGCTKTAAQKKKAVTAFEALMPVFQSPRCLNCHGGLDVFTDAAVEGHGGGRIDKKGGEPDISGCESCHTVKGWRPTQPESFFAARTAADVCEQIKRQSFSDMFLKHVATDELILAGFEGRRGHADLAPAPPSISHTEFQRRAKVWVEAMGKGGANGWGGPREEEESCGCHPDGGKFVFRQVAITTDSSGVRGELRTAGEIIPDPRSSDGEWKGSGTYSGYQISRSLRIGKHNVCEWRDEGRQNFSGTLEGVGGELTENGQTMAWAALGAVEQGADSLNGISLIAKAEFVGDAESFTDSSVTVLGGKCGGVTVRLKTQVYRRK